MQDEHPGVLGGHEGHTPKSCCPLRLILLLSRENLENLNMPRSFTFVCQLYYDYRNSSLWPLVAI